jgi:hypothetical protein
MFIEFTDWDFWTITIEALNVSTFATRTNTAYITFVVPSFTEETWALVWIDTGWALWSGYFWNEWCCDFWSTTYAFISWTTWRWLKFTDVSITVWTVNVGFHSFNVDSWTYGVVTLALVSWARAEVFRFYSDKTLIFWAFSVFSTYWFITIFAHTFTSDDLITAKIFIDVSPNFFLT